jgi:hypothetical protein
MAIYTVKRFSERERIRNAWEVAKKKATNAKIVKEGSKFGKYGKLAAAGVGLGLAAGLGKKAYDKKREKKFSDASYTLKRKLFFEFNGHVVTGDEIAAYRKANGGTARNALEAIGQSKTASANQSAAIRTETRALNKASHDSFVQMGKAGNKAGINNLKASNATQGAFNAGQKSVGAMGGMRNTWSRMGTMGKAGTIAAGAAVAGLALKGLTSGRKKNEN